MPSKPTSAAALLISSILVLTVAPSSSARDATVATARISRDEGVSHERYPAATEHVLGVAAISSLGCLSDATNAGARTGVAARAEDSFEAAARVAAACALARALDPSLTAAELRRALEAGEVV